MLSPLSRKHPLRNVWRVAYPVGAHYLISSIIANGAFALIVSVMGRPLEEYYRYVTEYTILTSLLMIPLALFWYRKDAERRQFGGITANQRRHLKASEGAGLLLLGAAFAQYGNMFMALLQSFLSPQSYVELTEKVTEGKSFWILVLGMGIIAPIAEEAVFRWLIYLRLRDVMGIFPAALISAVIFGAYHMNLTQGIYAAILGLGFAYLLEFSGSLVSSALLHIGANVWVLILSEERVLSTIQKNLILLPLILALFLTGILVGVPYFYGKYRQNRKRGV